MAQELQIHGYYDSLRDGGSFIDVDRMCCVGMEYLLSELLFKGDLKRVLYSKEDYAFRKRVELLGNGDVRVNDLPSSIMSLDLPFAIYSQSSSLEEDDRGSTQNAFQIVKGLIDPLSGIITKAAAVKIQYEATAFFARLSDVQIAARLLYWEKTPQAPLYFVVEHEICGQPLNIPIFITVDSIDTNPGYQEAEWLQKAKIFPVKIGITIRTYQTLIEDVDGHIKLPLRFSGMYGYNDKEVVFTQKTTLLWADKKWSPEEKRRAEEEAARKKGTRLIRDAQLLEPTMKRAIAMMRGEHVPEDIDAGGGRILDREEGDILYVDSDHLEKRLLHEGKAVRESTDKVVKDVVEGYFNEDRDCQLSSFHQGKATENSVTIEWAVKDEDVGRFHHLTLYVPGILEKSIEDSSTNTFEVSGLHPGSTYHLTMVVYSSYDTKLTYNLDLKTEGQPILGDEAGKKLSDFLVGHSFTGLDH